MFTMSLWLPLDNYLLQSTHSFQYKLLCKHTYFHSSKHTIQRRNSANSPYMEHFKHTSELAVKGSVATKGDH